MPRCAATKRNGAPCTMQVSAKQRYCWAHDPQHSEQRRRRAAKGGRSKANKEIKDLKKQLSDLADGVLDGSVDRGVGVVINQILNTRVRLLEVERKVAEQDVLLQRLEDLEHSLGSQNSLGGRRGL